jgi:FkbM family methyltransferase
MILNNLIKLPILKRAIPSILKKYIYWTNNYEKKITIENISYDLDLRHLIDRRFFLHRGYEDELYYNLCKIIKKEKIQYFLDIGSCWGVYSLRLANIFKNLRILAFDPIQKNIDRLISSIKKNKLKNIKTYKIAIGDKKGTVKLGATEDYSPNYKINKSCQVITEYSKINLIDNLIFLKNKKIIFKIDTETFEFKVIKGAKKLLKNNKCFLQIEIVESNKNKVINFLKKIGYKLISNNINNKGDYFFSNFIFKKIDI